jgi:hypothetical protein
MLVSNPEAAYTLHARGDASEWILFFNTHRIVWRYLANAQFHEIPPESPLDAGVLLLAAGSSG